MIYYGGDPGGSGRPRAIGAPAKKADAAVPRYRYREDPRRLAHAGLFNWLTLDEKRMLDPHNRQSASRGLGRLSVHPALTKAVGD